MSQVLLIAQIGMGCVLLVSATLKVFDRETSGTLAAALPGLSRSLRTPMSMLLIAGEYAIGAVTVLQVLEPSVSLALLSVVAFGFLLARLVLMRKGRSCNCFGTLSSATVGVGGVSWSAGFALLASTAFILSLRTEQDPPSTVVIISGSFVLTLALVMSELLSTRIDSFQSGVKSAIQQQRAVEQMARRGV